MASRSGSRADVAVSVTVAMIRAARGHPGASGAPRRLWSTRPGSRSCGVHMGGCGRGRYPARMPDALTYKIADSAAEERGIHRLNHRTFAGEIPQHAANPQGLLVDRFHAE